MLVGVADPLLEKAERAAATFGAERAVGSCEELLELGVDCVVVATPHDAHFEPARLALLAGADVLVEKPMVLRADEAFELNRIAAEGGVDLHVGYTFLYTRHVQNLRAAVAAGALGETVLATGLFATAMHTLFERIVAPSLDGTPEALFAPNADTYASAAHGGGQALSQLTHAVAVLLYVLDADPTDITGLSERHGFSVDVTDALAFRTSRGALVSASSTGVVRDQSQAFEEYRLFGTSAHAALDTLKGTLSYFRDGVVEEVPPLAPGEMYPASEPLNRLVECRLGRAGVIAGGNLGLRVTTVLETLIRDQGADVGIAL
jgi:predicted dehydrogenase